MNPKTLEFNAITQAEDYFAFFNLPYDSQFLNVNRLHILQKFSQFLKSEGRSSPNLEDVQTFNHYRQLLEQAYQLFQSSSPQEQKLFKVFQDKPKNIVMLSDIGVD